MFNDSIVPLNEIGLLKGGKKDAYPRLRQLTYWFSEGRDTTRNSGSAYAVPTDSAIWRGIAISTAENSIDDLAVLSQQQREYGELARAHDVPAVKAGYSTVFDRFPKSLPSNKRRAWARKQLRLIRMAAESNHGQAIDPVILEIIRLGSEAEKYVSKCMKEFRLALGTLPRDGALRHAVDNFSCIYAGGCFAIKAGVVPWTREKLRDAIADCFQGFLKTVHQQQNVPANAKRILLKKLSDLRLPLKRKGGALPSEPTEGFVQKTSKGTKYAIKTPVFADWFPDKKNEIAALTWLDSTEKLLKKADAGTSSKNREWAVTFPKWNASKGMRAIQFYDPRPN